MTDLVWPPALDAAHSELLLRDLTARSFAAFSGTARTVSRPGGQLLSLTLQLRSLVGQKRAILQGFLAALRGGVHRAWCHDHSYTRRGSFPTAELLGNNSFADGLTGWDASGGGEIVLSVNDRVLRSSRTEGTTARVIRHTAAVTVINNAAYVARVAMLAGHGAMSYRLRLGTSFGGMELAESATFTAPGLQTLAPLASALPAYYGIADRIESRGAGDFQSLNFASLARCARVDEAGQTGTALDVKNLPVSTAGLLLQGDQVQVGSELFFVTDTLNSDAAGLGVLQLHRPPRESPANDAPVIIERPMGLFMLANSETGWSSKPGGPVTRSITAATVEFIEAPPT